MEKENKNVDSKKKPVRMGVEIISHFDSMEQKLFFHAVVMPDIREVLNRYASALGCLGGYGNLESEEKSND